MGEVWRAFDQLLQRPVAVKFLSARGLGDGGAAVDRFLREARIAASVQHRNVVQTVDFGTLGDDRPYMVMELLDGESLATRFEQSPRLSMADLVQLTSLTLRGLSAVHAAGIVHRDLKPENIFLHRDADGVLPKIVDFGISRSLDAGDRKSALSTQHGLIVGTPDYMSPEQARGQGDIDRRADIYAMGVILYEGLCGQLPFRAATVGELIAAIIQDRPTPIRQLRPDVPELLASVIEQAMCPDRDQRFVDARVMSTALGAAGAELPQAAGSGAPAGQGMVPGAGLAVAVPAVLAAPVPWPEPASPVASVAWGGLEGLRDTGASRAREDGMLEAAMRASAAPVAPVALAEAPNLASGRPRTSRGARPKAKAPGRSRATQHARPATPGAVGSFGAMPNFDETDLGGTGPLAGPLEIDYRRGQRAAPPAPRGSRPTPLRAAQRPRHRQQRRVRMQVLALLTALVTLLLVGPALVLSVLDASPVPHRGTPGALAPMPRRLLTDRLQPQRRRAPGRHKPALRDLLP